jgi:hypothetical protein
MAEGSKVEEIDDDDDMPELVETPEPESTAEAGVS